MARSDRWQAPNPRPRLQLLPKPSRSARNRPRLRRQRQAPPALVDLIPPPPELEQLAAIAKELQRPEI